ncbi:MAG: FtsQ-type POTRA domain-containing protein [Rickettsiaceae bacterium]|nr:FtsQ-type POTRA domain-containing protein [Rickettsiaceae bacterium]
MRRKNATLKKQQISLKRKSWQLFYKIRLGLKLLALTILLLIIFTSVFDKIINSVKDYFYNQSADYGLVLKKLIIEGNENISYEEILDAVSVKKGDPILKLNLYKIKERLESNKWVETAIIERQLPFDLYISIVEKTAIAIWQFQNNLYLIDDEGNRITPYTQDIKHDLLQVIGQDANIYAQSLIDELEQCRPIKDKVISAVRYGNRRWNLNLESGVVVKMPEKNFKQGYKYLCKIYSAQKEFSQRYKMIDLRDINKVYFELR